MSEEFDKWFDEAGWKTGLAAKDLRPIWNNIKTWQDHIVDANKMVKEQDELVIAASNAELLLTELEAGYGFETNDEYEVLDNLRAVLAKSKP